MGSLERITYNLELNNILNIMKSARILLMSGIEQRLVIYDRCDEKRVKVMIPNGMSEKTWNKYLKLINDLDKVSELIRSDKKNVYSEKEKTDETN